MSKRVQTILTITVDCSEEDFSKDAIGETLKEVGEALVATALASVHVTYKVDSTIHELN